MGDWVGEMAVPWSAVGPEAGCVAGVCSALVIDLELGSGRQIEWQNQIKGNIDRSQDTKNAKT